MVIATRQTILKSGLFTMSLTLALVACSAPASNSPEEESAKAAVAAPGVEVVDTAEGNGMEMPLDGSSVEAFDASLALVEKHSTEENYRSLQKAISYLMAFDIGVRNNRARLADRLNGLNGYEVIAKVERK